jgi:hypothetical protein
MAEMVIPPGYALASLYIRHSGISHVAIVTFGFAVAAPPITPVQAGALMGAARAVLAPLHDTEVSYERIVVIAGNDGPPLRVEAVNAGTGTRTTQQIAPPQVTYLIKRTTGYAGRRYRGRMYVPFVSSTQIDQFGKLSTSEQTLLNTAAANWGSNLFNNTTLNTGPPMLLHADSPLSATPLPTTVTNHTAAQVVATQRRRLER